jgi:hypothetical protein
MWPFKKKEKVPNRIIVFHLKNGNKVVFKNVVNFKWTYRTDNLEIQSYEFIWTKPSKQLVHILCSEIAAIVEKI